jgi:hypothetical protein
MGSTHMSVPRILKMAKTVDARTGTSAFLPELGENLKIKKGGLVYFTLPWPLPSREGKTPTSYAPSGCSSPTVPLPLVRNTNPTDPDFGRKASHFYFLIFFLFSA